MHHVSNDPKMYFSFQVPQPLGILERNLYKGNLLIEKSCAAPGETEITRIRGMTMLGDGRFYVQIDNPYTKP
jgi:hypothetical protein